MRATTELSESGYPHFFRRYDSWAEFVEAASREPQPATRRSKGFDVPMRNASRDQDHAWAGGSFEDALRWARTGWAEGRDQFIALSNKFRDMVFDRIPTPELTSDVCGEAVNMDAYLMGYPEDMLRFEDVLEKRDKTLSITVDQTASCMVSATSIRRRGAAMAALVDLLEMAGYSVNLSLRFTAAPDVAKMYHVIIIPIKEAGQPLDADLFGFAMVSPTVQRRLSFSTQEQESQEMRKRFGFHAASYYGCPVDPIIQEEGVTIPGGVLLNSTDAQIADWIIQQLTEHQAIRPESAVA